MNFPELGQQLLRPLDMSLGDAREKQQVKRGIPEMPLGFQGLPLDLEMITEHCKHQVRQPQRDDHPVDGINAVKPIDKVQIDLEIGKEKVEVLEKRQHHNVQNDEDGECLLPVSPLIGPEQPPPSEVISHHQHPDQGKENGDERQVIRHTRQHQPQPAEPGGADVIGQHDEG